jgi:hypothetical protein
MGLGRLTINSITHTNLHKPNNKLVDAWLEHFGARMNHGQTRTHKTHHGPDLGEAITFPLIIYYVSSHMTRPKCHFVPRFPNGSPEILQVGTPTTLGAHNFV